MILEPKCSKRKCAHFVGVKQDGKNEKTERVICKAFPDGIPDEIAYGNNDHIKPMKGDHGIQFAVAENEPKTKPPTEE
jgi:hypothetical protein